MKEQSEKTKTVRAIAFATISIAALIVIFAKEFTWTIIFTTLILAFFGIASTKDKCYIMEKPIVKEKITKTKKK